MTRLYRIGLVLALVWTLAPLAKAEDYITVESTSLKSNPQAYWARGIVFSDVLESIPGGKAVKLGDRTYLPIQTRILGTCYIDASLEDAVKQLKLGEEYLFAGSVYQKDSGLIFAKRRFYIVIKRVTASIKKTGDLAPALQEALARSLAEGPYAATLQSLNGLLAAAQKELQAYCASSNIDIKAVFEPGSPHAHRAQQTVRQALFELENKSRIPTAEYAVSLVTAFLAAHNGALAPAPTAAPVEAPAVTNETPVTVTTEPTPITESTPIELAPTPEAPTVTDVVPAAESTVTPEEIPAEPAVVEEMIAEPAMESQPEAVPVEAPVETPAASVETILEETPTEAPATESMPAVAPASNEAASPLPTIAEPIMEETPPAIVPEESPTATDLPLIDAPAEQPAASADSWPSEPVVEQAPVIEAEPPVVARPTSALPAAKLKLSLETIEEPAPAEATPVEPKPKKRKAAKSASPDVTPDPADAVPLR